MDISGWDVGNATCMDWMFSYSEFNGDINKWDVSNVTSMYELCFVIVNLMVI